MKMRYLIKDVKNLPVVFDRVASKRKALSYISFLDIGRKPGFEVCLLPSSVANHLAWERVGHQIRRAMKKYGRK